MFKRFFLFFGVNILIVMTISLILNLLGVRGYISAYGLDYTALMIFCLVWGMGGAFISLMLSKWMAKTMMGVQILSPTGEGSALVQRVHQLARKAGLKTMPEVGIYDASDINAFATGPSKSNSLVAVSTGLLDNMNDDEVEGVLAHEVAHIANGDMVTMTLLQGVMNAFVMFFARIVAFFIDQAIRDNSESGRGLGFFAYIGVVFLFEFIFGLLGSMVVAAFSRFREFKADSGGARLAGKQKMIAALQRLQSNYDAIEGSEGAFRAMQISSRSRLGMLLSTHPDLSERIKALQKNLKLV